MEVPKLVRESKEAALPPGTLVHIGKRHSEEVRVRVLRYDGDAFDERYVSDPSQCRETVGQGGVTWIDVCGLHDSGFLQSMGSHFNIHPLILEDIMHTGQRPKFEDHETYLFFVLTMLRYVSESDELLSEQFSIIAGDGFVLTFQEREGTTFDPLRERISAARGRIRSMGADYLTYSLVDTVVDHYFLVLEHIGEKAEKKEEMVLASPGPQALAEIQEMQRAMIIVRKSVWPLRDALGQIVRGESKLIKGETDIFFRDVYDHLLRIIDTVETYRDMLGGLMDIHLSSMSNRMNEIMKTLTIMASLFIPLTFIAGIYGMNFEHMPELKWRWGYAGTLASMAGIALALLVYFRRRKWLS